MFFLFLPGLIFKSLALSIFCLACLSDYLDGFLARRHNVISNFGIIMDPIADKILVLASFLSFVEMKLIPAWMVVIVILREFLITGLRIFALSKGRALKAERAGKHKTMSQMFTIFVILLFLIVKEIGLKYALWNDLIQSRAIAFITLLMMLTVIFTATSGISFLLGNRHLILRDNT